MTGAVLGALIAWLAASPAVAEETATLEIARGTGWVSPYWGYSTPKIVWDGNHAYTAGLWGANPDTAEGVLYRLENGRWRERAHLPGIYQPATLAADAQGRLIVAYTRQGKPVRIVRAQSPGESMQFDELPAPPDMENAYYLGVAARGERLYLAYIATPDYSMYLCSLDLASLKWTPRMLLSQGQVVTKPKTAWTYPILYPTAAGLHIVASNSPDGGDRNTYNEGWYAFVPEGSDKPAIRERFAESPIGYNCFITDMRADSQVRVAFLWNLHVYGDAPVPGERPGCWAAQRDPATGAWSRFRMGPTAYASFLPGQGDPELLCNVGGQFRLCAWKEYADDAMGTPIAIANPAPPGFFDVLSEASGSRSVPLPRLAVADGLLPNGSHVMWSFSVPSR